MTSASGGGSLGWRVFALVAPVTVTYTVEGIANLVPLWVAGHDDAASPEMVANQVAAVGLGNTALTFVAFIVGSGWTGGQDTLVSQAFGRGDSQQARKHLHQCQVWMGFFSIICSGLLFRIEEVLVAFGVANDELAALASEYVVACVPGVWFQFQYDALRKFLLNQQLPTPGLVVLLLNVPTHIFACYALLHIFGMSRMQALGVANTLRAAFCFAFLALYTSIWCPRPSCKGWWKPWTSKDVLSKGLAAFARVGLPSTIMLAVDWLSFEVLTILAGWLSDGPELAAHVAAAGASEYLFMVVRGAPKAATAMVGAASGHGDLAAAWKSVRACTLCCCIMCAALTASIYVWRDSLVSFLLKDAGDTRDVLNSLMPMVVLQMLVDAGNSLVQGAHAGLGNHSQVTLGFVLTCWVVQLPLAYGLAFKLGWGVYGLRLASAVGVGLDLIYNVALLFWCLQPQRFEEGTRALRKKSSEELLPMEDYAALKKQGA